MTSLLSNAELTHAFTAALIAPHSMSQALFLFFFSVLVVDLRDSIVNFTAQRVSVCIRHFVLAVFPNAVLVQSLLQNN